MTSNSNGKEKKNGNKIERIYPCLWYPAIDCPIRRKWKLRPESLSPFCLCCNLRLEELEKELIDLRGKKGVRDK